MGTPLPDHPYSVGGKLYDDPARQIDPATPTGSSPVSIEKASSQIIIIVIVITIIILLLLLLLLLY